MQATRDTGPERPEPDLGTGSEIGPLSVNEVAELLGVVPRTVVKYIDQGKLRAEKSGHRHRVWLPRSMLPDLSTERSERPPGMDGRPPGRSHAVSAAIGATYQHPQPPPDEWLAPLFDRFAALEHRIGALADQLSADRAGYEEALAAKEEVIAALRRRIAQAESDHALLRNCLQGLREHSSEAASMRAPAGLWQRARHFLTVTAIDDADDDDW